MRRFLLLVIVVFTRSLCQQAVADEKLIEVLECSSLLANIKPSLKVTARAAVTVVAYDGRRLNTASGFIINSKGYVVTVNHVFAVFPTLEHTHFFVVASDCTVYPAELVWISDARFGFVPDMAVLHARVPIKNITPVKIGRYYKVQKGESVIVISSPKGANNIISFGKVVGAGFFSNTIKPDIPLIRTSAAVQPGSSGGMMLDGRGSMVIGMMVACDGVKREGGESACIRNSYAIPSHIIAMWLDFLEIEFLH